MAAAVRGDLPNSRMFQMATLIVWSNCDGGIFASAMRCLRATSPLAISGVTFPWCIRWWVAGFARHPIHSRTHEYGPYPLNLSKNLEHSGFKWRPEQGAQFCL